MHNMCSQWANKLDAQSVLNKSPKNSKDAQSLLKDNPKISTYTYVNSQRAWNLIDSLFFFNQESFIKSRTELFFVLSPVLGEGK